MTTKITGGLNYAEEKEQKAAMRRLRNSKKQGLLLHAPRMAGSSIFWK